MNYNLDSVGYVLLAASIYTVRFDLILKTRLVYKHNESLA